MEVISKMVNCPKCGKKLKQVEGKVKFAAQIDDKNQEKIEQKKIEMICEFNIKVKGDSKEFRELVELLDKWYKEEKRK